MNSKNNSLNKNESAAVRPFIQKIVKFHLSTEETARYLENNLSKTERLRIDLHVASCSICTEKLELLVAYRNNDTGKPILGVVRQINRRLAHSPIFSIEQQRNNAPQPLFAIKKKPRILSYLSPAKPKPESRYFVKLKELVLPSIFFREALAFFGSEETDWSAPEYDEGKHYFYTYRVDGQGNLLINITVSIEGYDKVKISVNDKQYIEKLEFNGLVWITQKIINANERKKISENDSISILPLRKKQY